MDGFLNNLNTTKYYIYICIYSIYIIIYIYICIIHLRHAYKIQISYKLIWTTMHGFPESPPQHRHLGSSLRLQHPTTWGWDVAVRPIEGLWHWVYPLVNIQKAIENCQMAIEIVDFPMKNGYVSLPEGINRIVNWIGTFSPVALPSPDCQTWGGDGCNMEENPLRNSNLAIRWTIRKATGRKTWSVEFLCVHLGIYDSPLKNSMKSVF